MKLDELRAKFAGQPKREPEPEPPPYAKASLSRPGVMLIDHDMRDRRVFHDLGEMISLKWQIERKCASPICPACDEISMTVKKWKGLVEGSMYRCEHCDDVVKCFAKDRESINKRREWSRLSMYKYEDIADMFQPELVRSDEYGYNINVMVAESAKRLSRPQYEAVQQLHQYVGNLLRGSIADERAVRDVNHFIRVTWLELSELRLPL